MTYYLCWSALFHMDHSIILKAYLDPVSATLLVLKNIHDARVHTQEQIEYEQGLQPKINHSKYLQAHQ